MEDPKTITKEHLARYFSITKEALAEAEKAPKNDKEAADLVIDTALRYVSDAEYHEKRGDRVLAFASLNYAHGWLDAGARLEVFEVHDSRLFQVD